MNHKLSNQTPAVTIAKRTRRGANAPMIAAGSAERKPTRIDHSDGSCHGATGLTDALRLSKSGSWP
jgi:hypothetical protein